MSLKDRLYDNYKHWAANGAVWIISDLHFGETAEDTGFEWKPTDDDLVRLINKTVGKKDTLVILGDVGNVEYVKKLKGYKVLVMGNHDKGASNYYKHYNAIGVYSDGKVISFEEDKKLHPLPHVTEACIRHDNLFDEVYEGPIFINEKVILSHEPIIDSDSCFYNIHGHIHNDKVIKRSFGFNVCADAIRFLPINLNNLLSSGVLTNIKDIHRFTIDNAITRKGKKLNKKD